MEIWKDIPNYEGLYQISDLGNIKRNNRQLKPSINKYGYMQVQLYKNGTPKNKLVHQLVAQTFIINKENKPTVNHKNGNKIDNRLENLEWATMKEQQYHSRKILGNKTIISEKCRQKQIELHERKIKRSDGAIFRSIKIASNGNESLRKHISECCKNKRKTAGGYGWEYLEEGI